jgi:hypothetical protein
MTARDSPGVPRAVPRVVAEERSGASGGLHLKYVDETAPLFRLRRSGVIQQPGGELHAAGGAGKKELAARGQRAGGSESCGHSFGCGILPPVRRASEGLPRRSVAGIESANNEPGVEPHSGSLVHCSELTHPWVGQTLTVEKTRFRTLPSGATGIIPRRLRLVDITCADRLA